MFDTRALKDTCRCVSVGFELGSTGFNNAEPQTSQGDAFISSRCFQGCSARLVYDFMIKMARLQPHTHAAICSCHQVTHSPIPTQLQLIFATIDRTIIHYALRATGCAASLLLCLFGPVSL